MANWRASRQGRAKQGKVRPAPGVEQLGACIQIAEARRPRRCRCRCRPSSIVGVASPDLFDHHRHHHQYPGHRCVRPGFCDHLAPCRYMLTSLQQPCRIHARLPASHRIVLLPGVSYLARLEWAGLDWAGCLPGLVSLSGPSRVPQIMDVYAIPSCSILRPVLRYILRYHINETLMTFSSRTATLPIPLLIIQSTPLAQYPVSSFFMTSIPFVPLLHQFVWRWV